MGDFRRSLALAALPPTLGLFVLAGARAQAAGERPSQPVLFMPNQGQWTEAVLFQARASGMVASVLADGLHLDLDGAGLRLRFAGASGAARAEGREPRAARAHFLGGRVTRDVPVYGRARLCSLQPGVDLELYERAGRLEYDLWLAPGTDAGRLVLELEGADALAIDDSGALCASVAGRAFVQPAPVAFEIGPDGRRAELACAWRALGAQRFGFALAERTPGTALLIDPVLVYGTHVGGSSADEASSAVVDERGSVYVTGWARSADFPVTGGSALGATRGKEALVFKLGPDGRELLYATSIGGRGDDQGVAIRVEPSGAVVVAGHTQSDDFPTTENAFDRLPSGGTDGFVLKLAPDGSTLLFSSLLGGSAEDVVSALELGPGGSLTVAGTTRSRDFPVSSSAYAVEPRGARDAFVARLDPSGERLLFSTRLGGSEDDEGRALAVDAEGCAYLTGRTQSHDFPTTLGAFDRERCGVDAFVAKLSSAGRVLLYSTFLGGSLQDEGNAIAVDGQKRAVVVGWTQSLDFPFEPARTPPGRKDGFAVRLSEMGNALLHATPLGGTGADEALGVALDPLGTAWVVGRTRSADMPASRDAHQSRLRGAVDGFLARLSVEGALQYATFLGGAGEDELRAVHGDRVGTAVVVCGVACDVPAEERGVLAGRRRGSSDAFVLLFDPRASGPTTPSGAVRAGLGF
jgi:hypothetical protein